MTEYIIPVGISLLLLVGAWLDWRSRRLPNWLAVSVFLTAIAGVLLHGGIATLPAHLLHFVVALAVGFLLFIVKAMGGGDGKTYAALAMAVPFSQAHMLLAATAFATSILAMLWLLFFAPKKAVPEVSTEEFDQTGDDFAKIPLGIAIAAGGICYFWVIAPPPL